MKPKASAPTPPAAGGEEAAEDVSGPREGDKNGADGEPEPKQGSPQPPDKLMDDITCKLKDIIGEEHDDLPLLVELVTVCLELKKSPEEMQGELEKFLGDKTGSFTSWLTEHVSAQ